MIPMVDLRRQYLQIKEEIDAAVLDVLDKTQFILGPNVSELEAEVARYHGVPHAVGVANGTDALLLALSALGIGAGDEVITTPFTLIATAEVVGLLGALPVFDIDPRSSTSTPRISRPSRKERRRSSLCIFFGQPCDMDPILDVARKHGLKVIEDCASSAPATGGVSWDPGDAGCFSFFPSKTSPVTATAAGDHGRRAVDAPCGYCATHGAPHHSLLLQQPPDEIQAAIVRVNSGHRRLQ